MVTEPQATMDRRKPCGGVTIYLHVGDGLPGMASIEPRATAQIDRSA
jgi:hypothetical protein